MKTLHERIPLAGFSKLPSIPQIAKVKCWGTCSKAHTAVPSALGSTEWRGAVLDGIRWHWAALSSVGQCCVAVPGLSGLGELGR